MAGDGFGFVRILINHGTAARPVFREKRKVLSEGDLLACPEMGTYFFYRHTALQMKERPSVQIGKAMTVTP